MQSDPTPPAPALAARVEALGNVDALREGVQEARAALAVVTPPLPGDSASAYAALYYPLLFLTETASAMLRHVLREAHGSVREENAGAAAFLAAAKRAALAAPPAAPADACTACDYRPVRRPGTLLCEECDAFARAAGAREVERE